MGLFEGQVSRKPNNYPWAQEIINALWHSFWTPNEFSFRSDYAQFHSELTDEERQVIIRTLSAIGQVEIAVKRFWADLGKTFPHPYISDMGLVMGNNEVIHNQAYEKLLDVLQIQDAFDKALKEPAIAGRVKYLKKYLERKYDDDRKQFVYALVLFTLFVENTSLFGQFYTIMHFNRFNNVLKDTAQQVQYTRLEEQLHAKAGILLINTLREEYPELFDAELERRVINECHEALGHERCIAEWILGDYKGEALDVETVMAFIGKRLNDCMVEAGFNAGIDYDKELAAKTVWMDEDMKGATMTDFFQKRPVEYAKGHRTFDVEELF